MTDRELLELAAKAAGHALGWSASYDLCWLDRTWDGQANNDDIWNPLADDGDALRLAVRLGISITPYPVYSNDRHAVIAKQRRYGDAMRESNPTEVIEPYGEDRYEAVRRAIVRSAAAIAEAQHENS